MKPTAIVTYLARTKSSSFELKLNHYTISGFIEGGDLHGVVSIKVLDSTKKEEVKALYVIPSLRSNDDAYTHSELRGILIVLTLPVWEWIRHFFPALCKLASRDVRLQSL